MRKFALSSFFTISQAQTLIDYAQKCDAATGTTVPVFSCDDGTEVPVTNPVYGDTSDKTHVTQCDRPNVLNKECDPGSKFQVLQKTKDAVVVAHCRKKGSDLTSGIYRDIAVIQYNKKNGALCFYQSPVSDRNETGLPGKNVPAPSKKLATGQTSIWNTPEETHGQGCSGCHDSGGIIRSPYLAQLKSGTQEGMKSKFVEANGKITYRKDENGKQLYNYLPNSADGYNNYNTPVKYVGDDWAKDKSWSIKTANAPGYTQEMLCTDCHRLAVNSYSLNGTAADFALRAVNLDQASKNPHSASSPIWMNPSQIQYYYDTKTKKYYTDKAFKYPAQSAINTATKFYNCAQNLWTNNFNITKAQAASTGCTYTLLGQKY